jgi:hypothetical protein
MYGAAWVSSLPFAGERLLGSTNGSPQEAQKKWRAWYVLVGGKAGSSRTSVMVRKDESAMGVLQWKQLVA